MRNKLLYRDCRFCNFTVTDVCNIGFTVKSAYTVQLIIPMPVAELSSWIFIHPSSSTPSSTLRILPDPTFFYRFVSTFTLASKLMISQKPVHSMKAMNRPYILLFNSYRLHRLCRPASMPGMARAARTVRLTVNRLPLQHRRHHRQKLPGRILPASASQSPLRFFGTSISTTA